MGDPNRLSDRPSQSPKAPESSFPSNCVLLTHFRKAGRKCFGFVVCSGRKTMMRHVTTFAVRKVASLCWSYEKVMIQYNDNVKRVPVNPLLRSSSSSSTAAAAEMARELQRAGRLACASVARVAGGASDGDGGLLISRILAEEVDQGGSREKKTASTFYANPFCVEVAATQSKPATNSVPRNCHPKQTDFWSYRNVVKVVDRRRKCVHNKQATVAANTRHE